MTTTTANQSTPSAHPPSTSVSQWTARLSRARPTTRATRTAAVKAPTFERHEGRTPQATKATVSRQAADRVACPDGNANPGVTPSMPSTGGGGRWTAILTASTRTTEPITARAGNTRSRAWRVRSQTSPARSMVTTERATVPLKDSTTREAVVRLGSRWSRKKL
jgi:hypothetical protein